MFYLTQTKISLRGEMVPAGKRVQLTAAEANRLLAKKAVIPMDGAAWQQVQPTTQWNPLAYSIENTADELDAIGILLGYKKKDMQKAKTKVEKIELLDASGQSGTDCSDDVDNDSEDDENVDDSDDVDNDSEDDEGQRPAFNPAEDA